MRRPRHKLQVSTFPFLLILLLLVMDRRSKIVARTRAIEAHAALVAARTKKLDHHLEDEEARRAEWERKRQELHDLLREQEEEVAKQREGLAAEIQVLGQDVRKEQETLTDLEQRLLEQRMRLDVKSQLLAQMRQGIARSRALDAASQLEVEKLARDLAQLERALTDVKMLKTQEQETYSLVPYRGKLHEGRRPVYVECAAGGIIFHPERRHMDNGDFDIQLFRNEVERRGVELVREKRDADRPNRPLPPKVSVNPYVLFLVRPDGLESYYNATMALRGFDIDYGYEFVDAQWALDFSQEVANGGLKPSLQQGPLRPARVPPPPKRVYAGQGYGEGGSVASLGPPAGATGTGGSDTGTFGPRANFPSFGPAGKGNGTGVGTLINNNGPGGLAGNPGYSATLTGLRGSSQTGPGGDGTGVVSAGPGTNPQPGSGGNGTGDHIAGPVGTGNSLQPGPGGYGTGDGNAGPAGAGNAVQPSSGLYGTRVARAVPTGPGDSPQPGAGNDRTGQGINGPAPGNPGGGQAGQAYSSNSNPQEITGQGSKGTGPGNSGGGQPGPNNGDPQDVAWRASPGSASQNPGGANSTPSGQGTAGSGQPSANGDAVGDPGPMDPFARLAPRLPFADPRPGPKKAPPAPSVGRLLANRDYLLTIECFGDVAALYPGGQVFAEANGANQKTVDDALVKAVLQLIARRQATVRAGEVPYRPMLRFQIHPEALRTYYHVYPLFENLRIPMTRENLDS